MPGDQAGLIDLYGGSDGFVKRLDYLHDQNITYIGNEVRPSPYPHTPCYLSTNNNHPPALLPHRLPIPLRRSPRPQRQTRPLLHPTLLQPYQCRAPRKRRLGRNGLLRRNVNVCLSPLLSCPPNPSHLPPLLTNNYRMGLFPNPGQPIYLITPPFFPSISITSPSTGATATIRAVNFDPAYEAIYIQSATLDGEPYTKNWIDHSFFTEGKELVLTLGRNESAWGTRVQDLPPSLSEYSGGGNGTNGTVGLEWRGLAGRGRARLVDFGVGEGMM